MVALIATFLAYKITKRGRRDAITNGFRGGRTISASMVSLAHGTGDAQKTMGIITLLLITSGHLRQGSGPPWWVILLAGLAIGSGTYASGWRIIRTMGKGLADTESPQGFAAETSSTAVLLASSRLGFAESTTQVVSGGILGAGLGRKLAEVRWTLAGKMALAWCFTLPIAARVGGRPARCRQRQRRSAYWPGRRSRRPGPAGATPAPATRWPASRFSSAWPPSATACT
ncbi:MAG TPA: inorganic phosphate transporter [Jatrophihabitantaceae bacterium]